MISVEQRDRLTLPTLEEAHANGEHESIRVAHCVTCNAHNHDRTESYPCGNAHLPVFDPYDCQPAH